LSQNVVHSDSDLILHNSSVLIDKEPIKKRWNLFRLSAPRAIKTTFHRFLVTEKIGNKKMIHLSTPRPQVTIFIKDEKLFFEIALCDSELNDRLTTSFLNGVQSADLRY
ncbi:hypothetical protein ACYQA7_04645, partial [Enterococcus faecium]